MNGIPTFDRYIGIDYSGAQTAASSLSGLRVYMSDPISSPFEVHPPAGPRKYWTRLGIAEWLSALLSEDPLTLVGIDHGFSFPIRYFERYGLPPNWRGFLDDFHRHWPTDGDNVYVDSVRDGHCSNAAARCGNPRWKRLTEIRARGAKSVFNFDVQGTVAKLTHSGLPWLRYIQQRTSELVHFWPFDGWEIPIGRSVVAEVYPAPWSNSFPQENRNCHQHDAYSIAAWMRQTDSHGSLSAFTKPHLPEDELRIAEIEGWILGVA
jgi:hypothetical protein